MSTKPLIMLNSNIPKLSELLKDDFDIIEYKSGDISNELLKISGANALISRSTEIINEKLLAGTNIEYYATATAGFNHLDLKHLEQSNIKYFISSGSNSNSVAEYVINVLFAKYGKDLLNRKIGIVGYGNIGTKLAKYCNLLGMKVMINDPPKKYEAYPFPDFIEYKELNDLIAESEILTNHVPLQKGDLYSTHNLFDENLRSFNGELLIHASRGGVIKETALFDLNCDLSIDVWENEPKIDLELLKKSWISTPHIAGHSLNGKLNATSMIYSNIMDYFGMEAKPIDLGLNERKEFTAQNSYNLLELVAKNRNILEDSEIFKSAILKSNDIAKTFVDFRANYRKVHETIK